MQETSKIKTLKALNPEQILERFKISRQSLCNDPYRPIYHYSTPENLMNDPNGLCEWNGQYHLFYQLKPTNEDRWHWGHTVSNDLIHWKDLPPAIYPNIENLKEILEVLITYSANFSEVRLFLVNSNK
mgnify:CR=1 FL=1